MAALNAPAQGRPYDHRASRGRASQGYAFYSKNCLEPIRTRLDQDRLKVIGFYEQVRVRYLDSPEYARFDAHGLAFHNVNTPDELAQAAAIMRESRYRHPSKAGTEEFYQRMGFNYLRQRA